MSSRKFYSTYSTLTQCFTFGFNFIVLLIAHAVLVDILNDGPFRGLLSLFVFSLMVVSVSRVYPQNK